MGTPPSMNPLAGGGSSYEAIIPYLRAESYQNCSARTRPGNIASFTYFSLFPGQLFGPPSSK